MVVMYQLMLKMDQKGQNMYEKGLKIEFFGPKIPVLFAEFCSAEFRGTPLPPSAWVCHWNHSDLDQLVPGNLLKPDSIEIGNLKIPAYTPVSYMEHISVVPFYASVCISLPSILDFPPIFI